jgi:hypothetical protein
MHKKWMFTAMAAALLLNGAALAHADETEVGTTAETFLKLGTGARAIAMGEAYTAVLGDASALSYNPAGIAESVSQLEYSHNAWFEGAYSEHLAGLVDLGAWGSVGGNVNYLSVPSQEVTQRIASTTDPNLNYEVLGSFSPYDVYATLGYANSFKNLLDYGVSLKAAGENVDGQAGTGVGIDLGATYRTSINGLVLGASVQNLGLPAQMEKDSFNLPEITRFGAGYTPLGKDLTLAVEVDMPDDSQTVLALGMEYDLGSVLYPRCGYRFDGIFNPWSAGFGVKAWGMDVDFATVPYGDLGQTYRVTVGYKFGNPAANQVPATGPTAGSGSALAAAAAQTYTSRVEIQADQQVFAPGLGIGNGSLKVTLGPDVQTPTPQSWSLFIFERKAVCRVLKGTGMPPEKITWDGVRDDGSKVGQGVYPARLALKTADGKVRYSGNYAYFVVYAALPKLSLKWDPRAISPKKADEYRLVPTPFQIVGGTADKNLGWRLEIVGPDGQVFRTFKGALGDTTTFLWDGNGDNGKEYYSNYIYEFRLTLTDSLGHVLGTQDDQMRRMVFAQ